ncbi:alcohol dehydrogenase catalytic domain-containing protein [Lysinibacillus sp. FSL M8-0134]|uniref:alcohol dehydrogenase catalytic domain-containing protein n=1 Tax=Lysinibacillus sp. FSL M8-0134 TaxID=2921717 RepID=UPI00311A0CBA
MLSKVFKVIEPKRFDMYIEDVKTEANDVLIKVDYISICKADLRYYEGTRDARVLSLKYPMSLIHEATGIVLKDPQGQYNVGQKIVMIPNRVERKACEHCVCDHPQLGENYCPKALFASSNSDGFSKEIIAYPHQYILPVPVGLENKYAVFSEMLSVAIAAIRRIEIPNGTIAIWGDGVLGYLIVSALRFLNKDNRIIVVGKHREKVMKFPVNKYFMINENIDEQIALAFECVGGNGAVSAINQILKEISVGGEVILTGVTEQEVPISTRKILEKGIKVSGITRSQKSDFEVALHLLQQEEFLPFINSLILSENKISSITEFYYAFEKESKNKLLGKHLMQLQF